MSQPAAGKSSARQDSITLLTGLTENSQLAPAIKAIYDRGWTSSFHAFLDRSVNQKDTEILNTCNEYYEELVYTIDHVLAAKQQASSLKIQIVRLQENLRNTSSELYRQSTELNRQRVIHQNLMVTIHILDQINKIFVLLSQVFSQIEEKRYFIALKTLNYVQNQLASYSSFDFAKQIEIQLPILANLVKNIVSQEFQVWLLGLKDRGPILGHFTLHSIHLKLFEAHKKSKLRLCDRLKSLHMYVNINNLSQLTFITQAMYFSATQRPKHYSPSHSTDVPQSPTYLSLYSNLYTIANLTLGFSVDIYDPTATNQPYEMLFTISSKYTSLGHQRDDDHNGLGDFKMIKDHEAYYSSSSQTSGKSGANGKSSTITHTTVEEDEDEASDGDTKSGRKKTVKKKKITTTTVVTSVHKSETGATNTTTTTSSSSGFGASSGFASSRKKSSVNSGYTSCYSDLADSNDTSSQRDLLHTLSAASTASISFTPLHQCLHVYQTLGQINVFRALYASLRHSQATSHVRVLGDNTVVFAPNKVSGTSNDNFLPQHSVNPINKPRDAKSKVLSYLPESQPLTAYDENYNPNAQLSPIATKKTPVPASITSSSANSLSSSTLITKSSEQSLSKPQSTSQIVSLMQLQQLYSELIGFFVIEDSIIRTGAQLLTRTELETLWDRGAISLRRYLDEYLLSLESPQEFLLAKECTLIFLATLETYHFNCTILYELLGQHVTTFKDLCMIAFNHELARISAAERYESLTLYDPEDYNYLVTILGLQQPNQGGNSHILASPQSNSTSPMSMFSVPNHFNHYTQETFPLTLPFSMSVPLIGYLLRAYIALLFEYSFGLSLPNMSLTGSIITYISQLVKDCINPYLLKHKPELPVTTTVASRPSSRPSSSVPNSGSNTGPNGNAPVSHASVPLAVQGRINTMYMLQLLQAHLRYINSFIEQRLGDNTTINHLSCFGTLEYTMQVYDRLIVDTLKQKVDNISFINQYNWVTTQYSNGPSDAMLDLTTFLHTTLSCTVFLPAAARADLCIQCYEHIAQTTFFALSESVKSFTQVALYNFLHDIREFELLSNTYQSSTHNVDSHDAMYTNGIDKKGKRLSIPELASAGADKGKKSKKSKIPDDNVVNDPKLLSAMTPTDVTPANSMLTISFQRLRQLCLLFVTNDFRVFFDEDQEKSLKYNLLDGIFLQGFCAKFKPTPPPPELPPGVVHVKKEDIDWFLNTLKTKIDAGLL